MDLLDVLGRRVLDAHGLELTGDRDEPEHEPDHRRRADHEWANLLAGSYTLTPEGYHALDAA